MQKTAEASPVGDNRTRSGRAALSALISATAVSSLGNGLTMLAVPWFVLITTGSAARTGLAGAMSAVALVFSGVFGGTLVDRFGFKRASIISDLASGVTVALIPTLYFLDLLSFWVLLALVFLGAVLDAPGNAARRSMVPALVKRAGSTLERAHSAMQFAQLTTQDLIAPLVAGLLIGFIGAASILYINTGTFVLSMLIVVLAIPTGAWRQDTIVNPAEETGASSYFGELKDGLRYVGTDAFLSKVIPISILVNFLVAPMFVVVLPVMANEVFDSASAFGLMAAGFGAGAGVGTIVYGAIGHRIKRFTVFWGSMAGVAAGLVVLALSTEVWMALLATVIIGLSVGPVNTVSMVTVQARVPESMMGRVLGLLFAASGFATPAGLLIGGLVVESLGITVLIVTAAVGIAMCALWIRLNPALRVMVEETETDAVTAG